MPYQVAQKSSAVENCIWVRNYSLLCFVKTTAPTATPFQVVYLEHLALNGKPFATSTDTAFFFESRSHAQALRYVDSFLDRGRGLALVYGDEGTGKTFTCRRLLDGSDTDRFEAGLLSNPRREKLGFLMELAQRFDLPLQQGPSLEDELIAGLLTRVKGKTRVLAIDDGQLLPDDALGFLQRLLDEEGNQPDARLRIILFGRPELVQRLLGPGLKSLRGHIAVTHCLQPLTSEETGAYISHRLLKAGSNGLVRFAADALSGIYEASGGYPAAINKICDDCLLLLYRNSKTIVDGDTLRQVVKNENVAAAPVAAERPKPRSNRLLSLALAAAVVVAIGLFFLRFRTVFGL